MTVREDALYTMLDKLVDVHMSFTSDEEAARSAKEFGDLLLEEKNKRNNPEFAAEIDRIFLSLLGG